MTTKLASWQLSDFNVIYSVLPLLRGQFSHKYCQKTPHSLPVRARYGVFIVGPAPGWYSARVPTIIYAISYYIGPCDNGTWLYCHNGRCGLPYLSWQYIVVQNFVVCSDVTSPKQKGAHVDVFSCNQAALWMVQSVHLSVCLSHLFDYVPIILSSWNFQELLPVTKVTSMQKVKVRGQRSRSQRSQPNLTVSGL